MSMPVPRTLWVYHDSYSSMETSTNAIQSGREVRSFRALPFSVCKRLVIDIDLLSTSIVLEVSEFCANVFCGASNCPLSREQRQTMAPQLCFPVFAFDSVMKCDPRKCSLFPYPVRFLCSQSTRGIGHSRVASQEGVGFQQTARTYIHKLGINTFPTILSLINTCRSILACKLLRACYPCSESATMMGNSLGIRRLKDITHRIHQTLF